VEVITVNIRYQLTGIETPTNSDYIGLSQLGASISDTLSVIAVVGKRIINILLHSSVNQIAERVVKGVAIKVTNHIRTRPHRVPALKHKAVNGNQLGSSILSYPELFVWRCVLCLYYKLSGFHPVISSRLCSRSGLTNIANRRASKHPAVGTGSPGRKKRVSRNINRALLNNNGYNAHKHLKA
jgi:hypothetical protein